MKKQDEIDLDALHSVSVAEIVKGPSREWNHSAKAPDLFMQWWKKHGDHKWSARKAARAAWYACAESLGVYDDQEKKDTTTTTTGSVQVKEKESDGNNHSQG